MHALAYAYGYMTLYLECGKYNDIADVVNSKHDHQHYCGEDTSNGEYAYCFNEYNLDDIQKAHPSFTSRITIAAFGDCIEYD